MTWRHPFINARSSALTGKLIDAARVVVSLPVAVLLVVLQALDDWRSPPDGPVEAAEKKRRRL